MKIVVDRNLCISAASCASIASKTFIIDGDGKCEFIHGDEMETTSETSSGVTTEKCDPKNTILEAARSCPVQAIHVFNDDGTPLV
jgi:ferredoxin